MNNSQNDVTSRLLDVVDGIEWTVNKLHVIRGLLACGDGDALEDGALGAAKILEAIIDELAEAKGITSSVVSELKDQQE